MRSRSGLFDIMAVFLCAGLFSAGGWLFWTGITAAAKPSGADRIGTLTFKVKNAQRKYSDRAVWEGLPVNSPLYARDSIRTAEGSSAVLRLDSGAEIYLEENTLILLDYGDKKRNIEFLYGNIRADSREAEPGTPAAKAAPMTISAKGSKVAMGSGKANLSMTGSGKLDLTVTQGSVQLTLSGKRREIAENEKAQVLPDAKAAEVERIPVQLASPGADERLISFSDAMAVPFSWKSAEPGGECLIEASRNADFSGQPVSAKAAGQSATLELGPGDWYARVTPAGQGGAGKASATVRFHVMREYPPAAVSPGDGEAFSYRISPPSLRFSWKGSALAASFLLEVSSARDFGSILYSVAAAAGQAGIDSVPEGDYWWRVKPAYAIGSASYGLSSDPRAFSVHKVAGLKAAQAILPLDGEIVYEKDFRDNGIRFSWKAGPESASSTLALFSKEDQGTPVLRFDTKGSSWTVNSGLVAGEYVWQVYSQAADGAAAPPSGLRALTISGALPQLKPSAPEDGAERELSAEPVRFAWESDSALSFLLEVSRDASFANPVKKATASYSAELKLDEAGSYYWRVSALDAKGFPISTSPAAKLELRAPLAAPLLESPKPGSSIELVNAAALDFSWKAVPGAQSYSLRLLDGSGAAIIDKKGITENSLSLTELSALSAGAYRVELSSQASGTSGARSSPRSESPFTLTRVVRNAPPELASPADGAAFDELVVKRSGIDFSWKVGAGLANAKFSLSKDPGFRQIIGEESPSAPLAKIRRLDPGAYYWMVSAQAEDGKNFASPIRRFEVKKAPALAPPSVSAPRPGENIDMTSRDSLSFSWKAVPEATHYAVKIVSRKNGAVIAASGSVKGTRWEFSDLSKLDVGLFSFSVQALSLDGAGNAERKSPETSVDFSIILIHGSTAPDLLSPDTIYLP